MEVNDCLERKGSILHIFQIPLRVHILVLVPGSFATCIHWVHTRMSLLMHYLSIILLYCVQSPSDFLFYPHNSNPRPANAAALLKQELAATSAAGAFDADSSGSDATAE